MIQLLGHHSKKIMIITSVILILTGCNFPKAEKQTNGDMSLIMTSAAQTASVELTQIAINNLIQQLTGEIPGGVVTATPSPQPASIASATPTSAVVTATAIPCYRAQFVSDVTIPDDTEMDAGEAFTKTWRLKNNGSCTWQSGTQLVFVSGNGMNGPASKDIGQTVAPGQSVDVSIALNAPDDEGSFTGYYQLRSSDGVRFGIGTNADVSFWVKIYVENVTYEMDANHPLDFDYNICAAKWSSTSGRVSCSTSAVDFNNGSVRKTDSPKFESAYQDDEGTIVVSPSAGSGGMVMGQYPKIAVKNGDHFTTMIGCMYQREDCNVLIELQYLDSNNTLHNLGSWAEAYDGKYTQVDVDLSSLDGKTVAFILKVNNNGDSKDDEVFWLSPQIVR
jgi:hypothetical protein